MASEKFDFDTANMVAFAKFCDLAPDKSWRDWISTHSTSVGEKLQEGKWSIRFIVFQRKSDVESKKWFPSEEHADVLATSDSEISAGCIIRAPSEDYEELEVFNIILDAKNGSAEVVRLIDLAALDLESIK